MAEIYVPEERLERAPPVPALQTGANLLDMIGTALNRGLPIEYMDKLIEMKERLDAEAARQAYAADMAVCKAEMPPIEKDALVDYQGSKGRVTYRHESIGHVFEVAAPVLGRHGFSHDFDVTQEGDKLTVCCSITHRAGHTKRVSLRAGPDTSGGKNAIQAIESAVSYLKRATFKLALGVAARNEGGDDGRGAGPPMDGDTVELLGAAAVVAVRERLAVIGCDDTRVLKWASAQAKRPIERVEDIPAKYQTPLLNVLDQQIEAAGASVGTARGGTAADATDVIDADDAAHLRAMLSEVGVSERQIVDFVVEAIGRPIASIDEIPAACWTAIMGRLEATRKKNAAEAGQGSLMPDHDDIPI